MGTSQGPVREALQRLEREGLVQRQAHSATFVTDLVLDEMYELFSIRSVIEGFAIRHTVECITPEQCDQLAHLTDLMREEGLREDMLGLTDYDMEFHRLICQWSGNATLLRAWDPLYSQIQRFVVRTHRDYFASVTAVADTHDPIVAALRNHESRTGHTAHPGARHVDLVAVCQQRPKRHKPRQGAGRCNRRKQPLDPAAQTAQAAGRFSAACCRRVNLASSWRWWPCLCSCAF